MTGSVSEATCKSKVQFILTGIVIQLIFSLNLHILEFLGDKEETDIRTFPSMTFYRGGIDSFVMTTKR